MTSITVHHLNQSGSQRILWLLEELGLTYEVVRYQRDPGTMLAPPELKRIHPLGKSPVVTLDGEVLAAGQQILSWWQNIDGKMYFYGNDGVLRKGLFDVNGLLEDTRTDIADFQKPFTHTHAPTRSFVEAIESIKPTAIIGVSTVPKLFNQPVIEAMSRLNARPIIFPYSNPTSRSECTAEEAYRWSNGQAIFASGSPFEPVAINGRKFVPGQGNNVYNFPAMGMAVLATEATRVTQAMFIVAAKAVAEQVTQASLDVGLIYPPQSQILDASLRTAAKIAEYVFDQNLARASRPADIESHIRALAFKPTYPA